MFCNLQSSKKNLACSQAAEKEAALARQEEEKAEQRKQSRAEKKASKKAKKNRIGEKRKADDDDEGEWGQEEEEGKKMSVSLLVTGVISRVCLQLKADGEVPSLPLELLSFQGLFFQGNLHRVTK